MSTILLGPVLPGHRWISYREHLFLSACAAGQSCIVRTMLEEMKTIDSSPHCLELAIFGNHSSVVRLLLEDGRCDPRGSCLGLAIQFNLPEIVALLVRDGRVRQDITLGVISDVTRRGQSRIASLLSASATHIDW